jgi:hypothetical protein
MLAFVCVALSAFAIAGGDSALAETAKKKAPAKAAKAAKKEAPKETPRVWTFARPNGIPTLTFGVLNGENTISFSCQPESNLMRVVTHIGSRGVKPGDGTPIRLTNDNVRMEFSGTAFASGPTNDGVDLSGATRIDAKFFGLFRAGDTMLLDIPGRKRGLPVRNSLQSADAFEKACGVK